MRRKIPTYIKQLARELRSNQTAAEQKIWDRIRNKQLEGYRFVRQYSIGRYIADFYCSKAMLAVEVDGKVHDSEERKGYDKIRDEVIRMYGIRVIRFTNDEILFDIDNTLKRILEYLKDNLQSNTDSST